MAVRYLEEARTLGEIGVVLRGAQLPTLRVVLLRRLAEQAVAAWERDDDGLTDRGEGPAGRARRHRAGTLALIGLAVTERGRRDGHGDLVVDLDPELVGVAMGSADDL